MKEWGASLICCACLHASAVVATPCVGDAFDQPFVGATDVVVRHSDIPASQFPGMWQEGKINGLSYRLFANGDGDVRSNDRETSQWQIRFACSREINDCIQAVEGVPPDAAESIAFDLQRCFFGDELVALEPPKAKPETQTLENSESETACEIALLPDDTDEVALQKMLVLAGANPGPADGLIGPQTLEAYSQVTGESTQPFSLAAAVLTLKTIICDPAFTQTQ